MKSDQPITSPCALDQAHARLQESEARFRAAFDHAAIGMALVDLDGRWLQVNSSLCRILGYSQPQMLTANVRSMVVEDDAQSDAKYVRQLLAGQIIDYRIVKRFIHQQGRMVWALLNVALVRDAAANASYFIYQVEDITARKEAEEALRSSEEEYRATFELAGVGKVQIDLETGRFTRVNRKFCHIVGYTQAELQCTSLAFITHPDDHADQRQIIDQMLAGKLAEYQCERKFIRKDGVTIWVSVNAAALSDPQGNVVRAVATVEDITDRKRIAWREEDRRQVLEMVARDMPLPQVLTQLVQAVERQVDGLAAIMAITDADLTLHAPTLPDDWQQALRPHCLKLAGALSPLAWESPDRCGVTLIPSFDAWTEFRPLAAQRGLAACWAVLIKSDDNMPLGLLTVFARQPRRPSAIELQTLDMAASLAAICLEHHNTTRQLAHLVRHDPLTGLPNRICFEDRVDQALKMARRENRRLALFVLDIDHFKLVNDTHGHDVGDALLQQFAHRIKAQIRATDTLARMGGDEFMLILPEIRDPDGPTIVARKIIESLKAPFRIGGQEILITSSIGIALYPPDGEDSPSLKHCADQRMYQVKQSGRNGYADRAMSQPTAALAS